MRVTFVLPCYPWKPVGGFRVVYEYANQLVARGHQVAVVHPSRLRNDYWSPENRLHGIFWRKGGALRNRLLRPSVKRWQSIDSRVRLLYVPDLSSRHVPDGNAVFATAWQTAEQVDNYPPSKGEGFYLIQHYEIWDGHKDKVDATWRLPLRKVVIARWLYDLGREMGCGDMTMIPNGLDLSMFRMVTPIGGRPKRVAMMFSRSEWKGSSEGLAALEEAKSRHPALEAVLFGVHRRPEALPSWIDYRRDPAQQQLVEEIYNSARIFICPSWTEGFALPPAEAMACGCAVVSTDCGGNREYAEHGVTALLSQPRNPEALAENIIRLLEDDDLRVRIATEGHKRIQSFTWERSTDLLEEFIKSTSTRETSLVGRQEN